VLWGRIWEEHGTRVEATRTYLPASWDKYLRNIDIKFSAYKAKEWETYFYGVAPGLLEGVVPEPYYTNYLKIVSAIRILRKRDISSVELDLAEKHIIEYVEEFEQLYYQNDIERVHFCRPSLHKMLHHAPQARRLGPFIYITQWTLERTIGILASRIKQPSKPYEYLSQQSIRLAQCQALRTIDPSLLHNERVNNLPCGGLPLPGDKALLPAREWCKIDGNEKKAIQQYLMKNGYDVAEWDCYVHKWVRLQLPNGESVRTLWKESQRQPNSVRVSRQIK
ncbi:hypothetical protein BT69DRAFT_1202447, partial [Atractiella rhizophila]